MQRGNSRTFLLDKDWFTVVIEFQPSSWSKGTYLNMGVDFHFYPRNYLTFSFENRHKGFESFENENQSTIVINELCDFIISKSRKTENKFYDIQTALYTLKKIETSDLWLKYNVAVLYALNGKMDLSKKYFVEISAQKCEFEWENKRKKLVDEMIEWTTNDKLFLDNMKLIINKTRELKKLPIVSLENLTKKSDKSLLSFIRNIIN